jgi:hypothetical protein
MQFFHCSFTVFLQAKATSDKNLQSKLNKLAMHALNRAEELKMKPQTNKKTSASPAVWVVT